MATFLPFLAVALAASLVCPCPPSFAEEPAFGPNLVLRPELAARSRAEFRSAVSERPLRETLDSIASAAKLNVWLDRRADPTVLVQSATEARTPFQAIASVAQSVELIAVAVDNMVVVGREPWVEAVVGEALSCSFHRPLMTVTWPPLTTPSAAADSIDDSTKSSLPHDLWPGVRWTEIQPEVAHLLIAAQFDLLPDQRGSGSYQKIVPRRSVSAFYPQGPHMEALRSTVIAEDKAAKFKTDGSRILVTATPKAHVAGINRWLAAPPAALMKSLDIDEVRFTLRLENASAEQVFRQFANAGGRNIVISPQAAESCKKTISLTATDESLHDLSQRVADAANVKLRWTESQLDVFVD